MASALADPVLLPPITSAQTLQFSEAGFVTAERLIGADVAAQLCARLELVLRGEFDLERPPDKAPKFDARVKSGKARPALGGPSKRTLQLINCWKCDAAFRALVLSPTLGAAVAALGGEGWEAGARVANDQVWAKPPGANALSFHRDSAYFDFVPAHVITVWIALDDMEPELGPLQYVRGSHRWTEKAGTAAQFFVKGGAGHRGLLLDAAAREAPPLAEADLEITTVGVKKGGCGIHNGRLWHGSDRNTSKTVPRRGLGIHFVPADAVFRVPPSRDPEGEGGKTLAARAALDAAEAAGGGAALGCEIDEALFPVTWRPEEA